MTEGAASAEASRDRPLFPVPPALAADGVRFRLQRDDLDRPFITELYISLRWDEMLRVAWSDEQRVAFLADQSAKQQLHYRTYYQRSELLVIEREGQPIGRLYLDRGHSQDLRVVDIGLLPAWRGRGLGAALLAAVQDEARAEGKRVSIHVENENPARRLYQRLGFRDISMTGPYWLMEWEPGDSPAAAS